MVFFPSYSYMQAVYDVYTEKYQSNIIELADNDMASDMVLDIFSLSGGSVYNIIKQPPNMKEADKEKFLSLLWKRTVLI